MQGFQDANTSLEKHLTGYAKEQHNWKKKTGIEWYYCRNLKPSHDVYSEEYSEIKLKKNIQALFSLSKIVPP